MVWTRKNLKEKELKLFQNTSIQLQQIKTTIYNFEI